jgi:anaerobic C4-dicarboxylate transporter
MNIDDIRAETGPLNASYDKLQQAITAAPVATAFVLLNSIGQTITEESGRRMQKQIGATVDKLLAGYHIQAIDGELSLVAPTKETPNAKVS